MFYKKVSVSQLVRNERQALYFIFSIKIGNKIIIVINRKLLYDKMVTGFIEIRK